MGDGGHKGVVATVPERRVAWAQLWSARVAWPLVGVLLAGLLMRLWAMRFPPLPQDMQAWIFWGEHVLRVGPANFYQEGIFADYIPGYVYVMGLTAAIKLGLFPNAGVEVYHFLYRLPPVLCDLATAVLIFGVVRQAWLTYRGSDQREDATQVATVAAACHALNPAIIFNSATWGQIDSTFTCLMLLAVILLLRRRPTAAVVSYVLAFLIKPQAISLAPLIGLVLLLRFQPRVWLRTGVTGVALAYVILLPFFGWNVFGRLISTLQASVETYPYTSLFTYNLWGINGFWKDDRVVVNGLSLRTWGTLLYLIGLLYGVPLLIRQLRLSSNDTFTYFGFAAYFTFLPVMVMTRMHERYIYPLLPFLLIFAFIVYIQRQQVTRLAPISVALFTMYAIMTVLHTINLYQVYLYYLIYREAGMPPANTLYAFVDRNSPVWSAVTLALFGLVALSLPWWFGWSRRFGPPSDRMANHAA